MTKIEKLDTGNDAHLAGDDVMSVLNCKVDLVVLNFEDKSTARCPITGYEIMLSSNGTCDKKPNECDNIIVRW
jgi:hypothetical protein